MALQISSIQRISTSSVGVQADGASSYPNFSLDGTKVVFNSYAANLVAGDTNYSQDTFVKDLQTGIITLVSKSAAGVIGNGPSEGAAAFSPDGSKVIFASSANNLVMNDTNNNVDIFQKDLMTGQITLLSTNAAGIQANSYSHSISFSADGTKMAFISAATNLIPTDINPTAGHSFIQAYVKDLVTGEVTRVSQNANGTKGNS